MCLPSAILPVSPLHFSRLSVSGVPTHVDGVLQLRGAKGHKETGDSTALQPAAMGHGRRGAEGFESVEPGREGLQIL